MELSCSPLRLNLRDTFRIARESSDVRENVLVRICDAYGQVGLGEAAPSRYYGQTADSVTRALADLDRLDVDDPFALEDMLSDLKPRLAPQSSALAAVDMALHDLVGKALGVPLHRLWGLNPDKTPVTSFTIGLASLDEMRRKTQEAAAYPVLKVKLGTKKDRDTMAAIRQVTSVPVRVDANAAWTAPEAVENLAWLEDEGVELVEQPVAPDDLDGLRRVTDSSNLPIIADESARTPQDVVRLRGCVHGINIKLAKCGGLREALKMIHIARAQSMKVMLGCFIESSIGITAAAHLSPLVDYADLDGNLLVSNDPFCGVQVRDGNLVLPRLSGIGVKSNAECRMPNVE